MGTGLVKIYTEEKNREILQNMLPEAILTTYENDIMMTRTF
jgi:NAD(P)H-hydrate epimerase